MSKFENRSNWAGQWNLGDARNAILTDSLNQTGRFIVIGEKDMRAESMDEQDFGAEILVEANVRRDFVHQKELFGRLMRFFSNEIRVKAMETDTAKVVFSGYRTRP